VGGMSRSGVAGGSVAASVLRCSSSSPVYSLYQYKSTNVDAASVLSAMALTMAAEQREINQLRKRLKVRV
jgi:hypothetical protein